MTDVLAGPMTEDALYELLSLGRCVNPYGTTTYHNSDGQLHRVYGPAIEHTDGFRSWYQNGQRHRMDGPAVEYSDGGRTWYQNGRLHRLGGPAIERVDGYCAWWQYGQRHRIDGPAIEHTDGSSEWYINGKPLSYAEWQQHVASIGRIPHDSSGLLGEPQ